MAVIADISDVDMAVGKLQELGNRMRSDGFDFKDSDVANLENVISAITELEEERKLMHEKLETETIKCSILRHDLKLLPRQIKDETLMAVNAARQLNADALKNLRDQLESMNSNILDLETQSDNLERENIVLHPESELLRQQHEEIISQLNQKMAVKAAMQINLNETRDKMRQTDQNIIDLEDGMVQLKEDLIQERTEAKNEKKRFRKAVIDTQIKTRNQKEQNVNKKKELDTLQEKLIDSEGRLDSIRKSLRHYETSKIKLEADEKTLTTQLADQLQENQNLHRQGAEILSNILKEQQEFENEQNQLMNKIKTFEDGITKEKEKSVNLDKRKDKLHSDLNNKERIKKKDVSHVQELDGKLQVVKRNLAEKAEKVGYLHNENMKLTQESKALSETHKAIVTQLNKQIEDLREQLTKNKNERIELQNKKDETGQTLDDIKSELQQFMKDVTESIQVGKKRHSQLSSEGQQLQKEIREIESEVKTLQSSLSNTQQNYEVMFNTMQTKVDTLKEEILNTEKEIDEKKNMISEKTPVFQDCEKCFLHRSQEYGNVKKSIVALKNQKTGLEEAIKKGKKEREDMKASQETFRSDLKNYRTQIMAQVKHHGSHTMEIEQKIFLAGCQCRMILEENDRFEEACKKLESDLADLEIQSQENEKMKMIAQNYLEKERGNFMNQWKSDNLMQEVFASRDEVMADAFGSLLMKAEKRENKIDEVTLKLREELTSLSDFLNNIASMQTDGIPPSAHNQQKKQERSVTATSLVP